MHLTQHFAKSEQFSTCSSSGKKKENHVFNREENGYPHLCHCARFNENNKKCHQNNGEKIRLTHAWVLLQWKNHRIIGWKRPLSPTITPTPPCLLNHVLKCHIYTFFEHLQGWWLRRFPGQPVPMPDQDSNESSLLLKAGARVIRLLSEWHIAVCTASSLCLIAKQSEIHTGFCLVRFCEGLHNGSSLQNVFLCSVVTT